MKRTHFLHVRKTGGTAVKTALAPYAELFELELHAHAVTLTDVAISARNPAVYSRAAFSSRPERQALASSAEYACSGVKPQADHKTSRW